MKIKSKNIELKNGLFVQLRECESKDANIFSTFTNHVGRETNFTRYSTMGREVDVQQIAHDWQADIVRADRLHLGAFHQNEKGVRLLGYCKFRIPYANDFGFKHVADFGLFCLAETWGQNLAKALMNEIFDYAHSVSIHRLEARVRSGNHRAIQFFSSLGFQVEGLRKDAVLIDGVFVDEIYIAKRFNQLLENE
jgi:L-amino acid N-acyltransferase YncA